MLLLTRKPGERIIVKGEHHDIVFMVQSVRGNQVKIGIEAPKHIEIYREELYDRILQGEERIR